MIINKLRIKNFLSVDDITINFDDVKGLVLLEGLNMDTDASLSNGSGKSSIIEGLIFALFGKTIRKTTEKTISNYTSKKGCAVYLTVNEDIEIYRAKSPTFLSVKHKGIDISRESIPDTQAVLEKMLGFSYKSALSSLVFGQHNTVNFMSASPDDKRRLVQKYLNIDKIFDLRKSTLELKSEAKNELKDSQTKHEVYSKEVSFLDKKIKDLNKKIRQSKAVLSNPSIIDLLKNSSVEDLQELQNQKESLVAELASNQEHKEYVKKQIKTCKELIQYLQESSKCSNCDFINPKVLKKISQTKSDLEKHRREDKETSKKLGKLTKEFDKITIPIHDQDLSVLRNAGKFATEITALKDARKRYKTMLKEATDSASATKKRYELLRFWEKAFSEKGLVKYIIRNILDFMNDRCNYYLSFLSNTMFYVKVLEDLNISIYKDSQERDYDTLSGGERRRIDLAVTLALNDLTSLSNSSELDLVFFDEAAENLDKEGIQGFYNLLNDISLKKKIFLITHNSYLKSLLGDTASIKVTKKEGKSFILPSDMRL
tara:strand:- start:261 stop:1889 length:1629 start_codon:yes stop_codon:yes gene_type:complete